MPIENEPTREELANRIRADIKTLLPNSDPYDPAGMPNAQAVAYGNRQKELYDSLSVIVRDTFTRTAEGQALLNKGLDYGLTPNDPSNADGTTIYVGIVGSVVPITTTTQGQNGESYTTDLSKTIEESTVNIPSLTSSGVTATAVFNSDHNLGSGMTVTISDSTEPEYNGDFEVTVVSSVAFQYTLLTSSTSPATGTPKVTYISATVNATSVNTGQATNIVGGSTLTLSQSIAGVENTVYTTFSGIDGGADVESEEDFRERLELKQQQPETPFNDVNIILEARKVAGVTRVWVFQPDEINTSSGVSGLTAISGFNTIEFPVDHDLFSGMQVSVTGANEPEFNGVFECLVMNSTEVSFYQQGNSGTATGSIQVDYSNVQPGQVRILFVRDGDLTIIPSQQEIQDVKDQILTIKPAHTSDVDVIVEAPIINTVDFQFGSLVPDTTGLRSSIEQNLTDLFFTTEPSSTVTEDAYRNAIQQSFDIETKQGVTSFTLVTPVGDILSEYNEIIAIGDISYS